MSDTSTVTIRQTDAPSRSKQAGPCWIAIGDTYAGGNLRTIEAEVGDRLVITGKATLRRSRGSETERGAWTVEVTGDPADTVTVSVGRPQSVDAEITGVRLVTS